jgi:hypothetical protein
MRTEPTARSLIFHFSKEMSRNLGVGAAHFLSSLPSLITKTKIANAIINVIASKTDNASPPPGAE